MAVGFINNSYLEIPSLIYNKVGWGKLTLLLDFCDLLGFYYFGSVSGFSTRLRTGGVCEGAIFLIGSEWFMNVVCLALRFCELCHGVNWLVGFQGLHLGLRHETFAHGAFVKVP